MSGSDAPVSTVPLLPGQDASKIPSADVEEFDEVVFQTADLVKRPIETD